MTTRLVILLIVAGAGALLAGAYTFVRARGGRGPERLDIGDLDLELMSGCCAFIVFTSPACRPCKAALNVVTAASEQSAGLTEVRSVDAIERSDLAVRYEVRTIPTVFLITASGHVLERWRTVPDRAEIDTALAAV